MTGDGTSVAVMMPKIARKTLGLADDSFSHIGIQHSSLVFTGEGITRPVTLPVSMVGTFHNDLLNNLFLYLSNNRHNGILGVTTGPLTKAIFFKKGHIVFSGSTDATERIGNIMMNQGYVTQEQIDSVEHNEDPRRFGVRLKEAGYITYDQLWEALRIQVIQICCSLVDFPVGTYFFVTGAVPGDSFSHFFIEPNEVLYKGMIELDEKHRRYGHPGTDDRSPLEVLTAMEESD